MTRPLLLRATLSAALAASMVLAACSAPPPAHPRPTPAMVRAQLVRLLPANVSDRKGWAADIQAAFAALDIDPATPNLCAALAVTEQESGFRADPAVPGLPGIARAEMDRRAANVHVPSLLVGAALLFKSPNGRSYADRLAAVKTEQDLSRIYEDFIGSVPLGRRLFASGNPVHTGGPMQVSIAFAEAHARGYPYPFDGPIRHEVFTRRGGLYFGIAHLLDYEVAYPKMIYRFADYNAGFYASRNAAFQNAASLASGIPLALDGDLVGYGAARGQPGATEVAVRALASQIGMSEAQVHRALQQGDSAGFATSDVYTRVFDLAERQQRKPLPRALLPRITLDSPKITRRLTTAWFAQRVDERYRRCLARAAK